MSASTILVVDDEPANRRLLEAILKLEGYAVVQASNGTEALERVSRGGIELILLDVMMPGIDGIEVCRVLRERAAYVPVILVTALADQQSRVRGKQAGADDFLTKPVHEDELLVRARNLLRMHALHTEAIVQRREAQRESERWRLMSEVAAAVATCVDFRCLLRKLMDCLANDVSLDCAGILDFSGDSLIVRATCGHDMSGPAPKIGLGAADHVWLEELRRVGYARVTHTQHGPMTGLLQMLGYSEGIAIPVQGAGALHQVFVGARQGAFSSDEVERMTQLAPHIGTAVNNVRLHMHSEQLLRSRDELSQLIVHDLRNLLAVAQMNLEMVAEELPSSESLDDAVHAVERMSGLVAELLDVGAAEEGRLQMIRQPTDLGRLADEVLSHAVPRARHPKRTRLTVAGDAPVTAAVDPRLTRRVLENVVGNATRFIDESGVIAVEVERVGDRAVVSISNDGPSIPPDLRARLFEKYTGEDKGRQASTRGLGLYFCKLVVEAHGGTIRVADPPTGARFEISLPLL